MKMMNEDLLCVENGQSGENRFEASVQSVDGQAVFGVGDGRAGVGVGDVGNEGRSRADEGRVRSRMNQVRKRGARGYLSRLWEHADEGVWNRRFASGGASCGSSPNLLRLLFNGEILRKRVVQKTKVAERCLYNATPFDDEEEDDFDAHGNVGERGGAQGSGSGGVQGSGSGGAHGGGSTESEKEARVRCGICCVARADTCTPACGHAQACLSCAQKWHSRGDGLSLCHVCRNDVSARSDGKENVFFEVRDSDSGEEEEEERSTEEGQLRQEQQSWNTLFGDLEDPSMPGDLFADLEVAGPKYAHVRPRCQWGQMGIEPASSELLSKKPNCVTAVRNSACNSAACNSAASNSAASNSSGALTAIRISSGVVTTADSSAGGTVTQKGNTSNTVAEPLSRASFLSNAGDVVKDDQTLATTEKDISDKGHTSSRDSEEVTAEENNDEETTDRELSESVERSVNMPDCVGGAERCRKMSAWGVDADGHATMSFCEEHYERCKSGLRCPACGTKVSRGFKMFWSDVDK